MQTSHELTHSDIVAVVGIKSKDFSNWCDNGVIRAVAGGRGHGNHRRFSMMQALGLAVGIKLRETEQGCVLPYVAKVVEAFAAMSASDLEKQFAKGRTHLACVHHGKPILEGKQPYWIDVQATYRDVVRRIEDLQASYQKPPRGGRSTGLAQAVRQ